MLHLWFNPIDFFKGRKEPKGDKRLINHVSLESLLGPFMKKIIGIMTLVFKLGLYISPQHLFQ